MAPDLSRLIRHVTFALLTLAAAAAEIAAIDSRPVLESLVLAAVWVGLALGAGWFVPAPTAGSRVPSRLWTFVFLLLFSAPFFIEPLRRQWTGDGYPLELQTVFGLRNLGLGLAVCARWSVCLRLAAVVSFFLMLFAVSMTDHRGVVILLGLYTAAGSVWLMLVYWTGLRRFFPAAESAAALELAPGRERLPWAALVAVVGVVGCALGLVAVGPQRVLAALGEWLPTSGGTGAHDPFARGGLNDGDDTVKGRNPRSTGMTDADAFLDSPLPTLYDMFNDQYGEPFKPKQQERTVGLDGKSTVTESKKPPADNLRPSRDFPTTRQSPRQPRDPADRAARALFEVEGRTPLHVRVAAFYEFDGVSWREAAPDQHVGFLDKEATGCWMRVRERQPPAIFAETESHRFKIATSCGALVPTPPHLVRFRIARVDRADFFAWGMDRIVRMAARKLPAGVCVETEARTVDPQRLADLEFPGPSGVRADAVGLPARLSEKLRALARAWTKETPRGWGQIEAVVARLRSEYVVDPTTRVPEGCADPLAYFLLEAKRGPDYQFATAAALLLRTLGYPTRVVSGFYVAPRHYDAVTRHTPVVQEDLHFWAEVLLPSGDWLVIEPTPGYDVPGPSLPWSERLLAALGAALSWAGEHAVALTLGLLVAGALGWRRRDLADALAVAWWRWTAAGPWKVCVARALRLLACRGRWAGKPRPPGQTVRAWLRSVAAVDAGELADLARMAEWATYGADLPPPWPEAAIHRACRRALDVWTLRRWREVCRAAAVGGTR